MSTAVINNTVKISSGSDPVSLELDFKTLLLCTYRIQVKEKNSNQVIHDWSGDNSNEEDDKYSLGPGAENIGRTVWIFLTIIDQTGDGGSIEVDALFEQSADSSTVTTGAKELASGTNKADYILVVKITD